VEVQNNQFSPSSSLSGLQFSTGIVHFQGFAQTLITLWHDALSVIFLALFLLSTFYCSQSFLLLPQVYFKFNVKNCQQKRYKNSADTFQLFLAAGTASLLGFTIRAVPSGTFQPHYIPSPRMLPLEAGRLLLKITATFNVSCEVLGAFFPEA